LPTCLIIDGDSGAGLSFARRLGRAGWTVLAPRGSRAAASRHVARTVALSDAVRSPDACRDDLLRIVGDPRTPVDLVVPASDGSWELTHSVLRESGTAIAGGNAEASLPLLDKAHTLRVSEEAGFPVPAWIDPPTVEAVAGAAAEIGFPCVVKPRRSFQRINGAVKQLRHEIVRDGDEAAAAAAALSGAAGPPIVQALVSGRSLAVTAVIRDGVVLATAARETLSAFPLLGGNSVRRRTISTTEPGVAEALAFLVATGLSGLAEVEYQVDSAGTPRLMEIGPRPHGRVTLAVAAGVDLPRYAAAVALGLAIEPSPACRVGVEMSWPGGELYRLRAALSRGTAVPYPLTRRQVLSAAWPPWRPGMRYDGIDVRDLGPMLPRRFRAAAERSKFTE